MGEWNRSPTATPFFALARVQQRPPTARTFTLEEMRAVPGTLGDPFRILDTLPGVTPLLSGLPYVYVRGASPSGTAYVYDGLPLPSLFHISSAFNSRLADEAESQRQMIGAYAELVILLLLERTLNCSTIPVEDDLCRLDESGFARGSIDTYGVELFVKRPFNSRVNGWLSYTLGWAEGVHRIGRFTPEFDVRHLFNAVLQWRAWRGLHLSGRLHYRSGRHLTSIPTAERGTLFSEQATALNLAQLLGPIGQRLPGFFRADAGISYRWSPRWGRMQVSLEWLNLTLSREAREATCRLVDSTVQCRPRYLSALFLPNFGVRAEF